MRCRMSLPKTIILKITQEDINNSNGYTDSETCYLATTLKRLGYQDVSAGASFVNINFTRYEIQECLTNKPRSLSNKKLISHIGMGAVLPLTVHLKEVNYEFT